MCAAVKFKVVLLFISVRLDYIYIYIVEKMFSTQKTTVLSVFMQSQDSVGISNVTSLTNLRNVVFNIMKHRCSETSAQLMHSFSRLERRGLSLPANMSMWFHVVPCGFIGS